MKEQDDRPLQSLWVDPRNERIYELRLWGRLTPHVTIYWLQGQCTMVLDQRQVADWERLYPWTRKSKYQRTA